MEELIGQFGGIRYMNDEGTFFIGSLSDRTVVKGPVMNNRPPVVNLEYRFTGKWENHPKFGRQFSSNGYVVQQPRSREAVITYLMRYTTECKIGPVIAGRIVDAFGPDKVLGKLKSSPAEVAAAVKGFSKENAQKAAEQLRKNERLESTMVELGQLLNGRGFPITTIEAIAKKWKAQAPEVVKRNPFTLLVHRFKGAGFGRCDTLYMDLGHRPDSLKRQMICAWAFMQKDMTGSVWFEWDQVDRHLHETCGGEVNLSRAVELGVRAGWLKTEAVGGQVFIASVADSEDEETIADCVVQMIGGVSSKPKATKKSETVWALNEQRRVMG